MKKLLSVMFALLFNAVVGSAIASTCGLPLLVGAAGANIASLLVGGAMPGVLNEGVLTDVYTGEVEKKLRSGETASWLDGIADYSRYAENDVIHLVESGVDPDVLINNTTYPIPVQVTSENDITFSLDKFTTKATPITDDELYALSFDKMELVKDNHAMAILENKFTKAIHSLAPQSNSPKTPSIATTGEADGTRKRITRADIIKLKKAFDDMGVPTVGRRLVLCSDHVNDLLLLDQKFAEQYYNYTTGKISNLYSFEVFEYVSNPHFSKVGAKMALSATPGATDLRASVAFYTKGVFKCTGNTKMYFSEAKNDPLNHRNLINFEHRYLVSPKLNRAIGVIYSAQTT